MVIVGLLFALLLGTAAGLMFAFRAEDHDTLSQLEARIDELLPQTQCQQCGYPGCKPYARAVVRDHAEIDLCTPGGRRTVNAIADLLGRDAREHTATPGAEENLAQQAVIDENVCIGCTKCIPVCPVDAIIGAPKMMHTVITEACTGCELCIAPCPVDCIDMVVDTDLKRGWRWPHPRDAAPAGSAAP